MMKRTLSLILSVILILSVCVIPQFGFAAEGLSKTFSTADNAESLLGWSLPAGYVLSDADGLTHTATLKKVIYTGGTFSGKFEFSVDFKLVYENPGRVITNYIDDSNYYYVEINPKKNTITLKTFRRGVVSTHGTYDLPYTVKASNLVTARVISNGGEGMSFYLKLDGGEEATIFENVHVKDFIAEGTVGYDAQSNPLKVNNFVVNVLGEKDFVPPVEETPEETPEVTPDEPEEDETVDRVYDENALKVVVGLGIMDETALENGKAQVTAEEFAEVIKKLKSEYVSEAGKLTLGTAIEYMVKILGYDVMVGSRNSYYTQANSLKLLDGIDAKTTDNLIRYDLAQMIYNALDVELLQFTSYGDKVSYTTTKNVTLLTRTLEMGMVEGQVTDNGVTGINGPSAVGQYHMVINGVELFLHRDDVNRHDYIGRCVTAYYDNSDPDRKEILYIDYHEREKVLVITPETYSSYNANVFTYFKGNSTRTARISDRTPIYNGYYITGYSKSLFDNMTHGSITLVSSGNTNVYDTMIIRDYKSVYVNGVDSANFRIYNKSYDGVKTSLDFEFLADDNMGNSYVYIADAEGNKMDFSEIQVGDVISVAEANKTAGIAEILVSRETVPNFEINEIYTSETNTQIISDFTSQYKVNKEYEDAFDGGLFKPGEVALLYLDVFGYVSWAEISGAQELYVGVLANAGLTSDMDSQLKLAIFETDGEQQVLTTARKLRLLDTAGNDLVVSKQELFDDYLTDATGAVINEVIVYTIDDNDLITSIQLPLAAPDRTKDNYITKVMDGNTPNYQNISMSFGYNYFFASSPKFFAVEEDKKTDLEEYSMTTVSYDDANSSLSGKFPKLKCYSINGDNIIDYAILYGSRSKSISAKSKEAMVTSVTKVMDEESGLELYKIVANNGSGVTLYAEPSVATSAKSLAGYSGTNRYTVRKGDLIKYMVNSKTGWADEIVIVFRSDEYYPETVVGSDKVTVNQKGRILDATLNYGDSTNKNGNPLEVDSSFVLTEASLDDSSNDSRFGGRRIFYGWVYDKNGDIIEVTNQDLSTSATFFNVNRTYDYTAAKRHPLYVNQFYRISAYGNKINVVYSNVANEDTISVSAGSASSIKSYKEAGRNCSRVLIMNSNNEIADWYMIILNNE